MAVWDKKDGLSRSAWKSLVVKSLRMGWPEGIRQAASRLGKSEVGALLTCGVFEDVFPSRADIRTVLGQVARHEYEALCGWETHHGRGLTEAFCDLEREACAAPNDPNTAAEMYAVSRDLGFWMPRRAMNCVYTWKYLSPLKGGFRALDQTKWVAMPKAMLDAHTYEGKVMGTRTTILSGSYAGHRKLGQLVMAHGWAAVRGMVHSEHEETTDEQRTLGLG